MTFNEMIEELKGIKVLLEEAVMDDKDRRRLEALNDAINSIIMHSGSPLAASFEKARKEGRKQAWDLALKIARGEVDFEWIQSLDIKTEDGNGWYSPLSIECPKEIPIDELLESYATYEFNREIKIWDEVRSEQYELTWIVTRVKGTEEHRWYEGICSDGACYESMPDDIKKTGRSFPELAAVLERMNEDD